MSRHIFIEERLAQDRVDGPSNEAAAMVRNGVCALLTME